MTLEDRIAAIEAREAIADLILRHAEHIRSGTVDKAAALFVPDAVYELGYLDPARPGEMLVTERIEGTDAILGSKDEVAGRGVRLCPMIHNIRIAIDGDHAASTCVSMTTVWPMGESFLGEYRDRFARREGEWRFVYRAFVGYGSIDGTAPEAVRDKYQAQKEAHEAAIAPG